MNYFHFMLRALCIKIIVVFMSILPVFGQNITPELGDPWPRHVIDSEGSGADGVKLGDANGDGLPDIVTGWEESGETKIYLHPGYANAKSQWQAVLIANTPSVEDATFMDVNFDGGMDVVTCSEGATNQIMVHFAPDESDRYTDPGAWQSAVIPASHDAMQWMYAVPASFRADDAMDIVAAGKNDSASIGFFRIPENPLEVEKYRWHALAEVGWVMSIRVLDMDSDGDLDVLFTDRKGERAGIRWLENPGMAYQLSGVWQDHHIGGAGEEVMFMDVSAPGRNGMRTLYIAVLASEKQYIITLRQQSRNGLRWARKDIPIPTGTGTGKAVAVGDMNLDGRQDLVYSCEHAGDGKSGVIWLKNSRRFFVNRWIPKEVSGPTGIKYDRIELIDLDGDEDLDILICEENAGDDSQGLGVIWYENPTR